MEIKISLKNGEKESSFKFNGDPVEIIESGWSRLAKFWEPLHKDEEK